MIATMFRIFEEKNEFPCTLFHGVNGKRRLPLNEWIESETKEVYDGNPKHKTYTSGFHVLKTLEEVLSFTSRFKILNNRVVCKVEIDLDSGLWKKEHSPANVFLAKKMRINSKDWSSRIKLYENN